MGKYKTTNIRIDVFFSIRINLNVLMYNISKVPTFQNVFFFTLIIELLYAILDHIDKFS